MTRRIRRMLRTWPSMAVAWLLVIISSFSSQLALSQEATPRRVIHVSPEGNDEGEGTAESPWRSVQRALNAAHPGDVVRLQAGVYRERVSFPRSGRHGEPIVLEGDGDVVLDGSEVFSPEWQPAPDVAPGVYRAHVPFEPRAVVVNGKLLTLLNESRVSEEGAESEEWLWSNVFRNGVRGRWEGVRGLGLYRSDRQDLLVRFEGEQDPRQMEFRLAPDEPTVRIDGASRAVVRNLKLRNAVYGVRIENALGAVVEHCHISATRHGVWLDEGSDRCTVRFNTITQSPYSDYLTPSLAWDSWLAHKRAGFRDSHGIFMRRTEGGHQIHDNHIHDHWNGIHDVHWTRWRSSAEQRLAWSHFNQDLHVHHNRVENLNDDALEPNSGAVNGRWHHNLVINARCGLRIKAVDVGPLYIYRNLFLSNDEDIRIYGELELNPAEVYIYLNSSTADEAIRSNKVHGIGTPNYHIYNNLFWAQSWWGNSGDSVQPNWNGDHNVYVRRDDHDVWHHRRALAEQLGLDRHSRWVEDNGPAPFADPEQGDLSLTERSPARRAGADLQQVLGQVLPGTGSDSEEDQAPDAGALPFGQAMPTIPRDPESVELVPAGHWPE